MHLQDGYLMLLCLGPRCNPEAAVKRPLPMQACMAPEIGAGRRIIRTVSNVCATSVHEEPNPQSMHVSTGMEAQLSATRGGVMGGLMALSALERSSLQRVALQALPCQGGFVGLYYGEAVAHALQCMACTCVSC